MKIVMVSGHSCMRVHKQALPLLEQGHEVHLIARKKVPFSTWYKTFIQYDDITQCLNGIKLHKDADIFHIHNEPSWFGIAVKELTDRPVVMDVHDTFLTRSTPEENEAAIREGKEHMRISVDERNSFQAADGLVFVSKAVEEITKREFKLDQPSVVLPSYVPKSLYRYNFKNWIGGLVYQGRVTLPDEYNQLDRMTGADYCDYVQVANQCKEIGMDFHLYNGRHIEEEYMKTYQDIAIVHKGYDYNGLLGQLTKHDWGLVGNSYYHRQWQMTTPNKMFDYLASGVPSVCINAEASSEIVEEYGIGITVESIQELAERWAEHRICRDNIWKHRNALSMDENIHIVQKLYEELL